MMERDEEEQALATVTMRYFAHARAPAGCAEEALTLPDRVDADAVRALLRSRHPALAPVLACCRIAHNLDFMDGVVTLVDGDELAVIPPVSGG
jgi:molybdopterin converting factor subunit 1